VPAVAGRRIPVIACCWLGVAIGLRAQENVREPPTGEEFGGIAATGREVRVPYSVVYDLQGEKIGAVRIYLSMEI
jgi:predicted ester cyclase